MDELGSGGPLVPLLQPMRGVNGAPRGSSLAIAMKNERPQSGSEAFATLNPGLIRSYSLDRLNQVKRKLYSLFLSFQAGFQALMGNLASKCRGKTQARPMLKPRVLLG